MPDAARGLVHSSFIAILGGRCSHYPRFTMRKEGTESLSNLSKKVEELGFQGQVLHHWSKLASNSALFLHRVCPFSSSPHHPQSSHCPLLLAWLFFPRDHIYLCSFRAGLTCHTYYKAAFLKNVTHSDIGLTPCHLWRTLYCYQTLLTCNLQHQHPYNSETTCIFGSPAIPGCSKEPRRKGGKVLAPK